MSIRQDKEKMMIHEELTNFRATGMVAIAPFYINEDNRKEREK
jgi:hypothetical protein